MDTARLLLASDAAALRWLLALSGVVSETQMTGAAPDSPKPVTISASRPANESVPFLILSTQRVIQHYRRLLARHPMSEAERNIIHERIQREERVLRDLSGTHGDQVPAGQLYAVAA
jgi:RNase adaptor protein for sRNA GlmZ degradation